MDEIIVAKNISKKYKDNFALKEVSFKISKGQIVGLIGPNGAGKTTLLKALSGLHAINGSLDVLKMVPWQNRVNLAKVTSFIPDVNTLPNWMSVSQLFEVYKTMFDSFDEDKAKEYIKILNLSKDRLIKTCSKGMKAQLHLAMTIAVNADLLMLDEPTLGLDPIAREKFYRRMMDNYYTKDKTIIISSHQVDEIEPLLTHVLFLDMGNMLVFRDVAELIDEYVVIKIPKDNKNTLSILDKNPIYEFKGAKDHRYIFEKSKSNLSELISFGELGIPTLNDLFKALSIEGGL